jgi:hypothetical protein
MRRDFMLGTVFSAALAVAVSAQSGSQEPTANQDRTGGNANRGATAQTVTVTGCLRPAESTGSSGAGSAASGTGAGASATPSTANQRTGTAATAGYILTDASVSNSSGAASSTGTAGSTTPTNPPANPSTGAATSGKSGTTYRLTGSGSDFSSLVGKRVEVKGTLQNRTGSSSGSETGSTPGSTPNPTGSTAGGGQGESARTGAMSGMNNMPQLRATSVKEVPGSCSSQR